MTRTLKTVALLLAVAIASGAGCTQKKQDAPALSGPSELATSLTLYASPDTLRQDGSSQSAITIQAQNTSGTAIKSLPIRLDIAVGGTVVDYGQLSGKNLVTGSDGKATATYTAPSAPADSVDAQTVVQIVATPVGTDYTSALARSVSIRLVPPGIILPPNGTPTAKFTFSPSAPITKADVTFDASLSSDSDGTIASYAWNFGDGSQGSGVLVQHSYSEAGTYSVTLTVTDDRGLTASASQSVNVTATANPTAAFVISPTTPTVNQKVFFNAAPSTAATGRTLVRYDWDYGSGRQDSGVLVWQIYTQPGTYAIVLTVTDDVGNKGTTSQSVTVGSVGGASFSYLPAAPSGTDTVYFDGSASTSSNGIASYSWTFGDGGTDTGVRPSHKFSCPGSSTDKTFVVALTVKDTLGGTNTLAKEVKVTKCGT